MENAISNILTYFVLPAVVVSGVFLVLLKLVAPSAIRTVFKREVKSYFMSPIAYVCVVTFLLISNGISFWFGGVLERGEADLYMSYFQYLPWYFVVVAPAVGMRLWSEEQRLGTMELILTMPIAPWQAIVGKYLAASVVLFSMLVLSFPIVLTVNYLGSPDNGVILAGFVASLLVALSFLSITSMVSAFTRSQIVALLISIGLCLFVWLVGLQPVSDTLLKLFPSLPWIAGFVSGLSVLTHFNELSKGILVSRDLVFFLSFIVFCLFGTAVGLRLNRS